MRLLRKSLSCLIFLSLILPIDLLKSLPVSSEGILEKIEKTGLIKVALREDAAPFSYRDLNGDLRGICLDIINLIKQNLQNKFNRDELLVEIFKSSLYSRFDLIEDGTAYLECGPNTINENLDNNIVFSQPIFITGTQFLIKRENRDKVDPNTSLENVKIGVLLNTTNQRFLNEKYPLAQRQEFQGVTGRLRGIQSVEMGKIDAFASDGILLIGEAVLQNLLIPQDYILVPSYPLNCEFYGLILPAGDPQWAEFINGILSNTEQEELLKQWLTVIAPYIQKTVEFCQAN